MLEKKAIILFLILFLVSSTQVYSARKIYISTDKNLISNSEELTVSASASGFVNDETIYLKGAFYKDGSTNYFGFTKAGNDWIKNSANTSSQRQVKFGDWDQKLIVKNDPDDSGFTGSGEYKLKLGFYYTTSKGNLSSVKWSENEIPMTITFTPTQAPVETTSNNVSVDDDIDYSISNESEEIAANATITSKSNINSDKITTSPREASSYAKIKPITDLKEELEGEVLGEETTSNIYAVSLSIFGLFLISFAGLYLVKRKIREGKLL